MRVDEHIAVRLVRNALCKPFRQDRLLDTAQFDAWLKQRDILVEWQTLHHFWQIGILHPIAVRDQYPSTHHLSILNSVQKDRLVLVTDTPTERIYGDTGVALVHKPSLIRARRLRHEYQHALLWSPHLLWVLDHIDTGLQERQSWGLALKDLDGTSPSHRGWPAPQLDDIRQFSESTEHLSFLQLLALIHDIEPLVHNMVFPSISLDPLEPGFQSYLTWRDSQSSTNALAESGLLVSDMVDWHRRIAWRAASCDPVRSLRHLLRHTERRFREQMTGKALLAHTLYDTAEILRRYVERFHDQLLPEETDLASPEDSKRVHARIYDTYRPADYKRPVMRRIARRYAVDPGYRAVLFVEGDTELGFCRRWALGAGLSLDRVGVNLVNLHGIQNIVIFEDTLKRLHNDEVFAVVCLDEDHPQGSKDRPRHVQLLQDFKDKGWLPVDFHIWTPNMVERNFDRSEALSVASVVARNRGVVLDITLQELDREIQFRNDYPRKRPLTIESAINAIAMDRLGRTIIKNLEWGAELAQWAHRNPPPTELASDTGRRPIEDAIAIAARGHYSDYALTVERDRQSRQITAPIQRQ